ncbi:MAG: MBL fold metallo-hydrolase [Acidobacteriota bacterium]
MKEWVLGLPVVVVWACSPAPPAGEATSAPAVESDRAETTAGEAARADITYLGNEGFLIKAGGRKLLIDALYREGVPGYVVIPPERRELLEGAKPPFDDIDLVLTTHVHADHFDPQAVGLHLKNDPGCDFISTERVVARLRESFASFADIEDRVRAVTPPERRRVEVRLGGIRVEVLNLHHGRDTPVENLGFLIHVGGLTLLHVGDTQATGSDLAPYDLPSSKIDVAFLPFYHLVFDIWRDSVSAGIGARKIIVMHLPAPGVKTDYIEKLGGREKMIQQIKENFPNAIVPERQMQTMTVTGP